MNFINVIEFFMDELFGFITDWFQTLKDGEHEVDVFTVLPSQEAVRSS